MARSILVATLLSEFLQNYYIIFVHKLCKIKISMAASVLTAKVNTFLPAHVTTIQTPCRRVFHAKLKVPHLVTKFPALFGTSRFISTFTTPRHPFLTWFRSIQSMPPQSTAWRSLLILLISMSHLCQCLPSRLFTSGFPIKLFKAALPIHIYTRSAHYIVLYLITWIIIGEINTKERCSLGSLGHSPVTSFLSGCNILFSANIF